MTWGAYTQQGNLQELDTLGSRLSLAIRCPVHYPAYNKNVFECKCNVTFSLFIVKGAVGNGNWEPIIKKHKDGKKQ